MSTRLQYCHEHQVVETYPACDIGASNSTRKHRNQQLGEGQRPVVWENPATGEVKYLHTPYMSKHYEGLGYEKKEFTSVHEHKKWCDAKGVVNHALEGIKDEALKG